MVFPSSRRKPWSLQKHLSSLAVPFPCLRRKQKPTAKLSTFWKPKGTHSNMGSVCIYTVVMKASLGFFLMLSPACSHSFLSNSGCVLGNTELLCMFLQFCLYQQLPSTLPAPSAETWQQGDQTNTAAPVSLLLPASSPLACSPSPQQPGCRWKCMALRLRCKYP